MARTTLILLACMTMAGRHTPGGDSPRAYPPALPQSAMPF